MILISTTGGTKTQRELGEKALRFFVKKLLPRKRTLAIDLEIKNLLIDDIAALCLHVNKNEILIESHHRGTLYDYISFLAHEAIHMKQFITGELTFKNRQDLWHGEDFSYVSYRKQPWEIEAWKGQHDLAKEFIKNELGITLTKAKDLNPRSMKPMDWTSEVLFLDKICFAQVNRKKKNV